jgi:hypothetical protein
MECEICCERMKLPYSLSCGHSLCVSCTITHLKDKNLCPFCRCKVSNISPNFSLRQLLLTNVDGGQEGKEDEMTKEESDGISSINDKINSDKHQRCSSTPLIPAPANFRQRDTIIDVRPHGQRGELNREQIYRSCDRGDPCPAPFSTPSRSPPDRCSFNSYRSRDPCTRGIDYFHHKRNASNPCRDCHDSDCRSYCSNGSDSDSDSGSDSDD